MNGCITQSDTTLLIKRHAPKYLLFVNAIFSLADYITVRLQMRSAVQCHMLYPMQQQACNAVVLLRSFVPCQQSEPIQSLFANCECLQCKNIANNGINYCSLTTRVCLFKTGSVGSIPLFSKVLGNDWSSTVRGTTSTAASKRLDLSCKNEQEN